MRPRHMLAAVSLILLAAALHFARGLVADRDSFYHFRHAALYAERGPFSYDFPWAAFSVVSEDNADLWYGYHLLLAPLGWVADPVLGLKLAGVVTLGLSLVLFYWALLRLDARWPELWTLLLLTCAAPALLRMLAVRPHVLSIGLIALVFSFAVRGRAWQVGLSAAALAWVHLNLAWAGFGAALLVLALRSARERTVYWRPAVALLLGMAAGWLLRPNPFGAARLAWVQLPVLLQARQEGVPLLWGGEMFPRPAAELATLFLPLTLLVVGGLWLLVRKTARRPEVLVPLGLAVAFAALTFGHSARSLDLWKGFAVLGCALAATHAAVGRRVLAVVCGLQLWMLAQIVLLPAGRAMAAGGYPPDRLRGHAEWLAAHSAERDIVFHARWEVFSELFFWNTRNRYINGMDPIFLYARAPALYWEMHHLASGATRVTFAGAEPSSLSMDDTVRVLRRDFRARFLLVEADQRPLMYYARHERRLALRFEDAAGALFEVLPPQGVETRSSSSIPSDR